MRLVAGGFDMAFSPTAIAGSVFKAAGFIFMVTGTAFAFAFEFFPDSSLSGVCSLVSAS